MNKIFTYLVSISLLLCSAYLYKNHFIKEKSHSSKLEIIWRKDLKILNKKNILPKSWDRIGKINIEAGTDKAREYVQNIDIPIKENSNGNYIIDILVITFESSGKLKVIIQYDLMDPKNNVIWELGRTFNLGNQVNQPKEYK